MPDDHSSPDDRPNRPSWPATAIEFVEARLALIITEARDARRASAQRLVALIVMALCLTVGWMTLMVGLIGLLASRLEHWQWYHVTLAIAAGHFIIAGLALLVLRRAGPTNFPLTRQELRKDRSWLNDLKKNKH